MDVKKNIVHTGADFEQSVKREAGENPARSRRCKREVLT
ncbi:protein of unknown function [Tepidibacter aestuarii]|nr:protein of unknown function [Tepidibacter aestuarii]